MPRRRGRRRTQLLDDLKKTIIHCKSKAEGLDRICGELTTEEATELW
jgi:hypothetical protein